MEGKAISREDEVRSEKLTYHMIQMIVMIVILIEGQITWKKDLDGKYQMKCQV